MSETKKKKKKAGPGLYAERTVHRGFKQLGRRAPPGSSDRKLSQQGVHQTQNITPLCGYSVVRNWGWGMARGWGETLGRGPDGEQGEPVLHLCSHTGPRASFFEVGPAPGPLTSLQL